MREILIRYAGLIAMLASMTGIMGLPWPASADNPPECPSGIQELTADLHDLQMKGDCSFAMELCERALTANPNCPTLRYLRGDVWMCQGDRESNVENTRKAFEYWEYALADFKRALEMKPEYTDAISRIGYLHLRIQDHKKAIELFEEALDIDENHAQSHNGLGIAFAEMDKREKALKEFEVASKCDPSYANPYYQRAKVFFDLKRYDETLLNIDRAIELEPLFALYPEFKGNVLLHKKLYKEAIEQLNKAGELAKLSPEVHFGAGHNLHDYNWDEAIRFYTQAIQIKPDYHQAFLNRGLMHWNKWDFEKAIYDFSRAIEIWPQFGLALRHRGLVYMALGRYPEAKGDFDKLMRFYPENHEGYLWSGFCHLALKDYDKAKTYCEQAVKLDPGSSGALHLTHLIMASTGQGDEAMTSIDQHLQNADDKTELHFTKSEVLLILLDREGWPHALPKPPREILELALKELIDGRHGHIFSQDMFINYSKIMIQLGEFQKAYKNAQTYLAKAPFNYEAILVRGICSKDHLLKYGIQDFKNLITTYPNDYRAYSELGRLLATAPPPHQDLAQAIEMGHKGVELSGRKTDALEALAVAYGYAGRFDEAKTLMNEAIEKAKAGGFMGAAERLGETLAQIEEKAKTAKASAN
jgi:tetratricopeptide (TPR) repeat protein